MPFCDITIFPVQTDKKSDYLRFSERIAMIYREHGALRVRDFWQDDDASKASDFHAETAMANYETISLPDFRKLSGATENQTVVVSMTEWPSRQARDIGVKAATSDPRILATMNEEPVFDGSRLIAGGFSIVIDVT
jgi:uncharacterized protein YbaA (DUF1428 family)